MIVDTIATYGIASCRIRAGASGVGGCPFVDGGADRLAPGDIAASILGKASEQELPGWPASPASGH